jgi:hypothetical protein
MNERIEELKRQAWDYAYDHETVKGNVANDGFINKNFSDEFSKKFAELIVRECAQACINMGNDYEIKSAGQYQAELFAFAIKKHFGVEE